MKKYIVFFMALGVLNAEVINVDGKKFISIDDLNTMEAQTIHEVEPIIDNSKVLNLSSEKVKVPTPIEADARGKWNYEAGLLVGEILTDTKSNLFDYSTFGVMLERYISNNLSFRFVYEKNLGGIDIESKKDSRSCGECNFDNNDYKDSDQNTKGNQSSGGDSNEKTTIQTNGSNANNTTNNQSNETSNGNSQNNKLVGSGILNYNSSKQSNLDIDRFYLNGVYYFNKFDFLDKQNAFLPFVSIGLGYEVGDSNTINYKFDDSFLLSSTIGFKYAITSMVNFFAEAGLNKSFTNNDLNWRGQFGFLVKFGRRYNHGRVIKIIKSY